MKSFEEPIVKISYFDKENVLTTSAITPTSTPTPTLTPGGGDVVGEDFWADEV